MQSGHIGARASHSITSLVFATQPGKWQYQIADILGLSRQQISYNLKIIHGEWRDIPDPALRELRNRELARIDNLERTYWEAWENGSVNILYDLYYIETYFT